MTLPGLPPESGAAAALACGVGRVAGAGTVCFAALGCVLTGLTSGGGGCAGLAPITAALPTISSSADVCFAALGCVLIGLTRGGGGCA